MDVCVTCGKEISESEWIVNWTECSDCFDKHVEEYFKNNPEPPSDATENWDF